MLDFESNLNLDKTQETDNEMAFATMENRAWTDS